MGFEFDRQLTPRQKVFASGEWLPIWETCGGTARTRVRCGRILVDPEVNMTLNVGVENRYLRNARFTTTAR